MSFDKKSQAVFVPCVPEASAASRAVQRPHVFEIGKTQSNVPFVTDAPPAGLSREDVCDFVELALASPDVAYLVRMAFANIVAFDALCDSSFQAHEFRTRIDEHLNSTWWLAQHIYEANAEIAVESPCPPVSKRWAVGLDRTGKTWSSAN